MLNPRGGDPLPPAHPSHPPTLRPSGRPGPGSPTGADHLHVLAREPRPAGGEAEARARAYAAQVLREAGFAVHAEPFGYSAFPGRYATPIGGAIGAMAVIGGAAVALRVSGGAGAATLGAGLALLALFTRGMLGDAVLRVPLCRGRSENLVATRGGDAPGVWLVAHLDSKSQPVPSVLRVGGIALLATSVVVALGSAALQLAALPHRMGWWAAVVLAVLGAPSVIASVVGTESDGAVDNASGVAAVLLAASRVRPGVAFGVLLPSAEELGLAGARAWAREWGRERASGVALNCDGVDDHGALTIVYSGRRDDALLETLRQAAPTALRVRRMPLGLLTDSVALHDRGWRTLTVSRGGWTTLRRVHSRRDSLANLTGRGIDDAATLLARAVEALA
ncbi:MAG: peptidase [Gemmatimonadetes bacterium]|nr:peptidase [Gemmatimonadota bacterium]